jgi:hypothetical protein
MWLSRTWGDNFVSGKYSIQDVVRYNFHIQHIVYYN